MPEGSARGSQLVTLRERRGVNTLEHGEGLRVTAGHRCRLAKCLEVGGGKGPLGVRRSQVTKRVIPPTLCERGTTPSQRVLPFGDA